MLFEHIDGIAARLASGEVSAAEFTDAMLAEIRLRNPVIGGYSDVLDDAARREAAASDRRRSGGASFGPLDGIPIAIKDLINTTPAICKSGLDHLANHRPTADAPVVRALREAGAVILGVTETDSGAFSTDTPQCINPIAPDRTVGGSSGGSAAVVAAGLALAAIGTDSGGSIRIPAACCSIYGFKPSWGRVPTDGIRPLAPSVDHVGPLARSIADLRILQSVLDPALGLATPVDSSIRFGTCADYFADATDEILIAMETVICRLNARKVTIPLPDEALAFHMVNVPREAADYHLRHFADNWQSYPDIARETVALGSAVTMNAFHKAETNRRAATAQVDAALAEVDVILLPSLAMDAPLRNVPTICLGGSDIDKLSATIRYTALFNQTGHPVVSLPAALLPDGRAISIQLIGSRNADNVLLSIADHVDSVLSAYVDYASLNHAATQDAARINTGLRSKPQ